MLVRCIRSTLLPALVTHGAAAAAHVRLVLRRAPRSLQRVAQWCAIYRYGWPK